MSASKWGLLLAGLVLAGLLWWTKRGSTQAYVAVAVVVGIGFLYAPLGWGFLIIAGLMGFLMVKPGQKAPFLSALKQLGSWFRKGGQTP